MIRSPAARSALPVSVMSTTTSTMSGTFASVAPYDSRMSASMPRSAKKRLVSSGYSELTPHTLGQVLDLLPLAVAGHRHHDPHRVRRRLRVLQLAERDHLRRGLLHPVPTGDARDRRARRPRRTAISWGRRIRTDSTRGSSIVALYCTAESRRTARSASANSSRVAFSSEPLGSTSRSTAAMVTPTSTTPRTRFRYRRPRAAVVRRHHRRRRSAVGRLPAPQRRIAPTPDRGAHLLRPRLLRDRGLARHPAGHRHPPPAPIGARRLGPPPSRRRAPRGRRTPPCSWPQPTSSRPSSASICTAASSPPPTAGSHSTPTPSRRVRRASSCSRA